MSESISEMVIPGTYIDVRAEGLIGVSGIETGNIGVVGSANRGPLNQVVVLGSYSEALDTFGSYDRWPDKAADQPKALTLTRTLEQLFRGGASTVYAVRIANEGGTPMATMSWVVASATAAPLFTLSATSPGTWANEIVVRIDTPDGQPVTVTVTYRRLKETFTGATAGELAEQIVESSRLLVVDGPSDANAAIIPKTITASDTKGGPDGVPVTTTEIATGLDKLVNQPVNIVVAGGADAKSAAAPMLAHLEATENEGRERIAVMGTSSDATATIISADVAAASNARLIITAPGIVADDAARVGEAQKAVKLPSAYAAAVVAGRLSTLAPHVSLTNKDLSVGGLTSEYSRAEQKLLLGNQVLVVVKNLGIRVVKGITTDTGPFRQISVRRIVDYAKAGVRSGSNPYIGRLNNERVRAALKATLDGFLSGMVLDEMLTSYKLDVSATRAQEVAGQAIVTMTLLPTFSIDFVKVIMNLQ